MKKKGSLVVLAVGLLSLAVPVMVAAKGGQPPAQVSRTNESMMMNCGAALSGAQRGGWLTGRMSMVDAVAEVADMEIADVVEALQSGSTYADLADVQDILDVMMSVRKEALDQAVIGGRFTKQDADRILSNIETDLLDQLNQPWVERGAGNGSQLDGSDPQDSSGYRGNGGTQGKGSGKTDQPMLNAEDCLNDKP